MDDTQGSFTLPAPVGDGNAVLGGATPQYTTVDQQSLATGTVKTTTITFVMCKQNNTKTLLLQS